MGRLKEIEIAGKKFPINFSTKAAKAVDEKFGGIENMGEIFSTETVAGMMENLVWLLHLLIEQGIAYKQLIEGEEIQGYTQDELEILIGVSDIHRMKSDLLNAVGIGMKPEVEVETEEKNEETTQVN